MKQKWTFVIAALFSVLVQGAEPGTNFIHNGGFENETNPGMADAWGPYFWGWGMRGWLSFYQDLNTIMHVDRAEAFEGRKSMRLLLPNGLRSLSVQHTYVSAMIPGKEAVFSAYMKTVKGGRAQAGFSFRYIYDERPPRKTFKVDDQWRRYEMKFKVPKGAFQPSIVLIDGEVIWIDAVKLEHGNQATAFVPFTKTEKKSEQIVSRAKVPRYQIPVLEKAPELTGTMSDPLWKKGLEIKDFYLVKTGTPVTKNVTNVRMFIHGTTLYLAAECHGPNSEPLIKKRDGTVYSDDCFEFFLDPGNPVVHDDQKMYGSYYHFVFNSAGAVYDVYTGGETHPFNGNIRIKTSRAKDKWIGEIAIDLASLNVNPIKAKWRFMLGREDHTSNQCSAMVPLLRNYQSFHDYERYAEAEVPASVVAKLNSIQARPPELGSRGLALRLQSKDKLSAKYELTVSRNEKPLLQKSGRIQLGTAEQTLRFPLSAGESGQTTVEFAVQSNSGERLVRSWTVSADSGIYFRRNYYTSEKQAELIWNGELPKDKNADFNGKKVAWRKADGKLLFDLSGVPDGVYSVRIGGRSIPFSKYPPKANEVKIDRLNNILLVNSMPFFFYGPHIFWGLGITPGLSLETWDIKELKRRGFNAFYLDLREGYKSGSKVLMPDPDMIKKVLDVCAEHGLKVQVGLYGRVPRGAGANTWVKVNSPQALVSKLKDHPALLSWCFFDEPTAERRAHIWEDFNFVRKADPYHPIMLNMTSHVLFSDVFRDKKTGQNPYDIVSLTYYPISRTTAPDARLRDQHGEFRRMRDGMRKEHLVMQHAAQAFGYGTDWWDREPTPAEISFLIYMPLLYGNTGWRWFGAPTKCKATEEAIESYVPELNFLAEVIGNGEAMHRGEVFTSLCGNVIGTLRKYQGKYYLLTVSQSEQTVKTRFNLSTLLPGTPEKADVLFEKRSHDLQTDDHYQPFQRHVYVFEVR